MNDDRLRARLRAADPAAGLDPLPGTRCSALLDRTAAVPAAPRLHRRTVLVGALAAAAVAVTAVVLLLPRPPAPVLALTQPASDLTSICAPLSEFAVTALQGSEVAFQGTVVREEEGVVVVRPERFFRGGPAGEVRVRTDAAGGAALDGAVLRTGQQVLVAASDGQVAPCGLSAAESPELLRYYERAFG